MISIDQVLEKLKNGEEVKLCDIFSSVSFEGKAGQDKRLAALIQYVNSGQVNALQEILESVIIDGNQIRVELLGQPSVARQLPAGASSINTILTETCRRISMRAVGGDVRYSIGTGAQSADATSHYIAQNERLDLRVPAGANIAIVRASGTSCILELSELV